MGATVLATSSTDAKLEAAKKLGATELINYNTNPDWEKEVLRLTKGRGVDLVSDVGGSSTVEQSIISLRQGGTACLVGFLTPPKDTDIVFLLIKEARICMSFFNFPWHFRQQKTIRSSLNLKNTPTFSSVPFFSDLNMKQKLTNL